MPLPQYVVWRGNRLQYRRAFPKDVWPVVGQGRAFALSLRTDSISEAVRSRPEAERAYHAAVDAARAKLAKRLDRPPLSKPAAEALAVGWFLDALETAEDFRVPLPLPSLEKALDDAEWITAEARRALAEGDLADRVRLAQCLRDRAGYASEPVADAALARLLGRAAVAASEVERGRLVGDYGRRPKDPLFAAAMEAPRNAADGLSAAPQVNPQEASQSTLARSVADLERSYREVKFPGLSASAKLSYEPTLRVLREVLGAGRALASITHEDGVRLFDAVKGLPANAQKQKALKGLPTLALVEEGKRLGLPTIGPKTVNDSYMAGLGAAFRFAVDRGWMAINPVKGLRVKDPVNNRDRRDKFGPGLKPLFQTAPWTPRDASKPLHYWGPLLALYHGLRRGEAAGLLLRDVAEEAGEPMLLLRDGPRLLKSPAARRDMPVHPELVRLGFLKFVEGRRKEAEPEAPLFAGQKSDARGKWGRKLGEWFTRRVKALELQGRKLGMHSLRHDFRDALREAEVREDVANYLMGHAQEGMGAVYGGRPALARLKAAMEKVRYSGLNLLP